VKTKVYDQGTGPSTKSKEGTKIESQRSPFILEKKSAILKPSPMLLIGLADLSFLGC